MTEVDRIRARVAEQLALIEDPERRRALEALLVRPRLEEREWDYGDPGERYPYWVVAEAPERAVLLAYCEQGFGPEMPWSFLFAHDPELESLGMDAQWDWYLEGAFVRSGLWTGPVNPGYEEQFQRSPEERFGRPSRPDA